MALGQADDGKQAMELEDNVDDLADDAAMVDLEDAAAAEPEDEQQTLSDALHHESIGVGHCYQQRLNGKLVHDTGN